eukprot:COSAG01_NODE_23250_length_822_cov_1.134163_1_plen_159_part_10
MVALLGRSQARDGHVGVHQDRPLPGADVGLVPAPAHHDSADPISKIAGKSQSIQIPDQDTYSRRWYLKSTVTEVLPTVPRTSRPVTASPSASPRAQPTPSSRQPAAHAPAFGSCGASCSGSHYATGAAGDNGIANMWNRRGISVSSYYEPSHDLHPHPY